MDAPSKSSTMKASSGTPLPLAREPMPGGGCKSKSRIVIRMSEHDDERASLPAEHLQARFHQPGADPQTLVFGQHGHGGKAHTLDVTCRPGDRNRRQENMPYHLALGFSHKRNSTGTCSPEPVNKHCLHGLAKRFPVNHANRGNVGVFFLPDSDHFCSLDSIVLRFSLNLDSKAGRRQRHPEHDLQQFSPGRPRDL